MKTAFHIIIIYVIIIKILLEDNRYLMGLGDKLKNREMPRSNDAQARQGIKSSSGEFGCLFSKKCGGKANKVFGGTVRRVPVI